MGADGRRLTRTTHSKSRTGCITCKQRHVKCDEAKPSCQQCERVGKKCEGYQDEKELKFRWKRRESSQLIFKNTFCPSPSPTDTSPSPKDESLRPDTRLPSPLQIIRRTPPPETELHALEYFHLRTIPLLTSFFPSEFWTRLVPVISESAPAIKHCLLAIGSWHADDDYRADTAGQTQLITTKQSTFSLNQYGRALQALSVDMQSPLHDPQSRTVALLASLLFVVYESLRGRRSELVVHLKHGLSIAREGFDDDHAPAERFLIELILGRLGMTNAMFDQHTNECQDPGIFSLLDVVPRSNGYSSVEECTATIHNISNDIYRYIWAVGNDIYPDMPSKIQEQQRLEERCEQWAKQVRDLGILNIETPGAKILKARHELARTMIKCCHTLYQTSYDLHLDAFQRILDLVTSALQKDPKNPKAGFAVPGAFSVDLGILSLLTYTARLCRHPKLRRRAVDLLQHCPRREGVWTTADAVAVTNVIIEYEERRSVGTNKDEMPVIPESDRVHLVRNTTQTVENGEIMLNVVVLTRPYAGSLQLTDVALQAKFGDYLKSPPIRYNK